jgi:predicted dehydrogenase
MIRFGTLGAAAITPRALINPCIDEPRAGVYAIAARDRKRAEEFARYARIRHVFDDYQAVIEHPKIDAIYIPLPISAHHEWTIKALVAGKHVLCEKSLASNTAEAQEMADVAAKTGRVLMDAFHYRYHPLFIRAKQLVDSGEIGELREVRAVFDVPVSGADNIRMNYRTAGGVTMDIGCYPISWVRHITSLEPIDIEARAEVGPPDVDLWLAATMQMPGGIVAHTSGDMRSDVSFKAQLDVVGSRGRLTIVNPVSPQAGHQLKIVANGGTRTEVFDRRPSYGYQLDAFIAAIESGAPLLTGADDAVKQMRVIDRCYQSAGLPLRGGGS